MEIKHIKPELVNHAGTEIFELHFKIEDDFYVGNESNPELLNLVNRNELNDLQNKLNAAEGIIQEFIRDSKTYIAEEQIKRLSNAEELIMETKLTICHLKHRALTHNGYGIDKDDYDKSHQ